MSSPPFVSPKEWTTLHLICGAFGAATVAYVGVAWMIISFGALDSPRLVKPGGLLLMLGVAALLVLLAAPLAQHLLAQDRGARVADMPQVPFETYRQAVIVAFALREGTAVAGLVMTLLAKNLRWVVLLGGLAVLAMAWGWPTPSRLERLNRRLRAHLSR